MSIQQISCRVLSIDGGGIRGIIPAMVLKEIEDRTRKTSKLDIRISDLFDLIAGTSTGGILALGLTFPDPAKPGRPKYSAQDLLDLYLKDKEKIFGEDRRDSSVIDHVLGRPYRNKYKSPDVFHEKFGDEKMSCCLKNVMIVANTIEDFEKKGLGTGMTLLFSAISMFTGNGYYETDGLEPRRCKLFTRQGVKDCSYSLNMNSEMKSPRITQLKGDDIDIKKVAQITSAAPTFFPSVELFGKKFIDGGVLQNNPSIPCVIGNQDQRMFVVSIGTGEAKYPSAPNSLLDAGFNLFTEIVQSSIFEHSFMEQSPIAEYHRIQTVFTDEAPKLDAIDDSSIEFLVRVGRELIVKESEKIDEICRKLLEFYRRQTGK